MENPSARSVAEEHLYQLLQIVNDWLRFAETKNAGLVALSSVTVTALLGFVAQQEHISSWSAASLSFAGLLLMASLVRVVWSFLPHQEPDDITYSLSEKPEESDNLYYFGHLAKRGADQLLNELGLTEATQSNSPRSRIERDLASQVIINSRIVQRKLAHFQAAAHMWVLGAGVAVLAVFVTLIWGG